MDQLTVKDLLETLAEIRYNQEMSIEEFLKLPIYLGRDDELNGIHTGWHVDVLDTALKTEIDQILIEMINSDRTNVPIDGKAILIS